MMKKLLPFLICIILYSGIKAQDSIALRKHYLKVYSQALSYNDANAAINALHNYIAADAPTPQPIRRRSRCSRR